MSSRLEPEPVTRRDFLDLAGLAAAGLAVFGSIVGMARLPKPRVTPEASSRFRAGKPSEFPPGTAKVIDEYKVRVVSTDKGVAAMSMICTHLGCIVHESESGFDCPCHGSKFGKSGEYLAGPAPEGLPWHAVSLGPDGSLVVDTAKKLKAASYFKA